MSSVSFILVVFLFLFLLLQQGRGRQQQACPSSSCGKISNISYPFRLKDYPQHCGNQSYELACENNVTTVLYLNSAKYHVQSINYHNFTIRVVDPGLRHDNCSSIPQNFLSSYDFCDVNGIYDDNCLDLYDVSDIYRDLSAFRNFLFSHIVYLNCSHKVIDNPKYVDPSPCIISKSNGSYIYAIAGDLLAEDFEVDCHVKMVAPTSSWDVMQLTSYFYGNDQILSYAAMHTALVYGFEISWLHLACKDYCGDSKRCNFITSTEELECGGDCHYLLGFLVCGGIWTQLLMHVKRLRLLIKGPGKVHWLGGYTSLGLAIGLYVLPSIWATRILFAVTLLIAVLIYKWKKRHLSMYESIETYLQQNNMMPIRYSYKEIKKMARGFKDKLGEGGFGSVFRGNLRSGPCVAIKMLGKSKGNGHDFISEVATIGRIHHLNVVRLIGFSVEGSKRALLYEFMPNGSLDKFIFSKEGSIDLSYDKIYEISIGIARGIAYLHHGCEMKILHFDIKPHNILLDENFTPKVSDFGLAKLYSVDNSIVTMTAARGTIGYMAPELFYKNIGGVSYKADVYSFGMLLMEMSGKRRNLNPHAEHSSQLYFPLWIYDHLEQQEIEMEGVTEEEKKIVKKMIIVALWCIQLKPDDRPSMNKVVEMLEGDVESLEMPPKPTLYPHETIARDDPGINSNQTISSDSTSYFDSEETTTDSLIENIA